MAKARLTVRRIQALRPPETGRLEVFDTTSGVPTGFGVRVGPGGKAFFYLYRDEKGRLKRWTLGRHPSLTLSEAREAVAKIAGDQADPMGEKKQQREAVTFSRLTELFWEDVSKRLRPTTKKEWRRILDVELLPVFGDKQPRQITRADIRTYLRRKASTAPVAANRCFSVLRRVCRWGVEEELIEHSPVTGIKKPTVEHSRERVLDTDEIRHIWGAAGMELANWRAFVQWLFYTACRVASEGLSARWEDIDREERLWRIPVTKAGRSHTLPLSSGAMAILEEMRPITGAGEWIFPGPDGEHFGRYPQELAGRVRKNSGIDFKFHDIRRTTATELSRMGIAPHVVSAVLNHVSAGSATTRIYSRYSYLPEMAVALERWSERLRQILEGKPAKVVRIK